MYYISSTDEYSNRPDSISCIGDADSELTVMCTVIIVFTMNVFYVYADD